MSRAFSPWRLPLRNWLAGSYRYFDSFADFPLVNVGDSQLIVKIISASEGDLDLLRFIENGVINYLSDCTCESDDAWFHGNLRAWRL